MARTRPGSTPVSVHRLADPESERDEGEAGKDARAETARGIAEQEIEEIDAGHAQAGQRDLYGPPDQRHRRERRAAVSPEQGQDEDYDKEQDRVELQDRPEPSVRGVGHRLKRIEPAHLAGQESGDGDEGEEHIAKDGPLGQSPPHAGQVRPSAKPAQIDDFQHRAQQHHEGRRGQPCQGADRIVRSEHHEGVGQHRQHHGDTPRRIQRDDPLARAAIPLAAPAMTLRDRLDTMIDPL